jgi:serine-type D-Ala-D-Ala carboxypeptidase (penicillin-binding protein 5/6)
MTFRLLSAALIWTTLICAPAQAFETRATSAWVYDVATDTVLMDKNGDVAVPPASMSKLMTVNMLFEALKDGRVTMDTTFGVSDHAMSFTEAGGSTMFLQKGDRPTVHDLIRGMIVNSGNDACVAVAEGLAGSEPAFAEQMTQRGKAIGLTQSHFTNSSGWPDPGQRMSMKDLGKLAQRLITEFPELYTVFAETDFNYKNRAPANANNRNPLLGLGIGADGLKTGHTEEAGFGMVGSVKQGERRVIFAITGLTSAPERASEAEKISTWAFHQFALKTAAKAGAPIAQAEVFLGAEQSVGLVPAEDIRLLIPALAQDGLQAEVVYNGPLAAPIIKGSKVAELVIDVPGLPEHRVPLLTQADVAQAGFMARMTAAAQKLFAEYIGKSATAG